MSDEVGKRRALKARLREALPFDQKAQQPDFYRMMGLESWHRDADVPREIVRGERDQTRPVALGYVLEDQLRAGFPWMVHCAHSHRVQEGRTALAIDSWRLTA